MLRETTELDLMILMKRQATSASLEVVPGVCTHVCARVPPYSLEVEGLGTPRLLPPSENLRVLKGLIKHSAALPC